MKYLAVDDLETPGPGQSGLGGGRGFAPWRPRHAARALGPAPPGPRRRPVPLRLSSVGPSPAGGSWLPDVQ